MLSTLSLSSFSVTNPPSEFHQLWCKTNNPAKPTSGNISSPCTTERNNNRGKTVESLSPLYRPVNIRLAVHICLPLAVVAIFPHPFSSAFSLVHHQAQNNSLVCGDTLGDRTYCWKSLIVRKVHTGVLRGTPCSTLHITGRLIQINQPAKDLKLYKDPHRHHDSKPRSFPTSSFLFGIELVQVQDVEAFII